MCQISCQLLELLPRYGRCLIFQNGGHQPSWILKSSKFNLLVHYGRPVCISMPNFSPIGRTFAEIWPIFNFLRWQPSTILDLFYVYMDHPRRVFVGLCHCAKCGWNRCSSFDNIPHLMFCEFGLKMLIYAPFWVFVGGFDPLDETQYQPISQKLNLRVITSGALIMLV